MPAAAEHWHQAASPAIISGMNFTVPDISKWIAQPDTAIIWLQQNYLITWGVILGVS